MQYYERIARGQTRILSYSVVGDSRSLACQNKSEMHSAGNSTDIPVPFQNPKNFCLPYAVLNISFNVRDEAVERLLNFAASKPFRLQTFGAATQEIGIRLQHVPQINQSFSWLLSREAGMFMLEYDGHVASIDCKKKLIFDSGFEFAFNLSQESFTELGFMSIGFLTEVILPKIYRCRI